MTDGIVLMIFLQFLKQLFFGTGKVALKQLICYLRVGDLLAFLLHSLSHPHGNAEEL